MPGGRDRRARGADLAFCLFLLFVVVVFWVASLGYSVAARRAPWAVMAPLTVLLIWLAGTLCRQFAGAARAAEPVPGGEGAGEEAQGGSVIALVGGVVGLLGLVWLAGLVVGSGLYLLGFLRLVSRERWGVALGIAVAIPGTLWVVFQHVLGITLYRGVLPTWFG